MGAKHGHKLTKQEYYAIKAHLKKAKDDAVVIKKSGRSQTTVRMVRNTKNYDEYLERKFRYHGYPRKNHVASRSSEVTSAITPESESKKEMEQLIKIELDENKRLRGDLSCRQEQLDEVNFRYRLLFSEYNDFKNGYHTKLRTTSLVWLVIGLALGSALGTIITIMARGK